MTMPFALSWPPVLAVVAGLTLGHFFFASLRAEAGRVSGGGSGHPAARLLRTAAILLVFGAAAKAGVLLVALAAFHIGGGRVLVQAVRA